MIVISKQDSKLNIYDKIQKKLHIVFNKEKIKEPKQDKITIRLITEEVSLYQHFINISGYKNISDLVRNSVREKIIEELQEDQQNFSNFPNFSNNSLIGIIDQNEIDNIGNDVEKLVENINVSSINEDLLLDFIQKQQLRITFAISILRKKKGY